MIRYPNPFQFLRQWGRMLFKSAGGGPSTILTDLMAYWKLDEASDENAPVQRNDSHGANHLADASQCASAAGLLSNGLLCQPSKAISIADNAALSLGAGVAFEFWGWVKITTGLGLFQHLYLISKSGGTQAEYGIELTKPDANTRLAVNLRKADNSGSVSITHTTNLANDTWYFFSVYHDPTTDLSGVAINNGAFETAANTWDVNNSNGAFSLGGSSAGTGRATLDEVGFTKERVLTTAERTALYNAGAGRTYPFA